MSTAEQYELNKNLAQMLTKENENHGRKQI